ncbi:MAG TPA: hypothetical protein P5170_00660 [Candidatus Syntrophosphaera sp.]|nr:hypothetical protein [Candidatus Syntrophosphaera sp.]
MKQCKALLKKEWDTNWFMALIPLWATCIVYITALIGWIISLIRGHSLGAMVSSGEILTGYSDLVLYGLTSAITIMLGFVSAISAVVLAYNVINGGYKNRCEIFHFSQPVSFLKIAGSKFLLVSLVTILLYGLLSLLNAVVFTLIYSNSVSAGFRYSLTGWLQTFLGTSLSILFLGSLAWLFAGVYKRKSLPLGFLTLLAIEVVIGVLNYTTGWHIPSLFEFLGRMIALEVKSYPSCPPMNELQALDMQAAINKIWNSLLSWNSVLKLALSAVFVVAGAWFYKSRELS